MNDLINTRNENGVKDSTNCYRNIKLKGIKVFFEHWTSDPSNFESERKTAKNEGLRTRIINGELYRELIPN